MKACDNRFLAFRLTALEGFTDYRFHSFLVCPYSSSYLYNMIIGNHCNGSFSEKWGVALFNEFSHLSKRKVDKSTTEYALLNKV